jgi:uncharacterized membrane protein
MDSLHTLNIVLHVTCGTAAMALGLIQLVAPKGGATHRRLGRLFVYLVGSVVVTAALGLALFGFRAFLAVLTLLVAYWTYSGLRAARNRGRGPQMVDGMAAVTGLVAVGVFLYWLPNVRFPWVPGIIYSILGTLTLVALYDLTRFAFPRDWHDRLWLYEHIVKMIGAHAAIVAAFSGTVLSAWQPYSQILPSVVWTGLQIGFALHHRAQIRRAAPAAAALRSGG